MSCPYKNEADSFQTLEVDNQSYRNLALTGFELEVLQRFDLFHDEHGIVYAYLELNANDDLVIIRDAAFKYILKFMALSEGIDLENEEIDLLVSKVEESTLQLGDLMEGDEINKLMGFAA